MSFVLCPHLKDTRTYLKKSARSFIIIIDKSAYPIGPFKVWRQGLKSQRVTYDCRETTNTENTCDTTQGNIRLDSEFRWEFILHWGIKQLLWKKLQKLNQCKRTLDLVSRETFVVDVLCGKYHWKCLLQWNTEWSHATLHFSKSKNCVLDCQALSSAKYFGQINFSILVIVIFRCYFSLELPELFIIKEGVFKSILGWVLWNHRLNNSSEPIRNISAIGQPIRLHSKYSITPSWSPMLFVQSLFANISLYISDLYQSLLAQLVHYMFVLDSNCIVFLRNCSFVFIGLKQLLCKKMIHQLFNLLNNETTNSLCAFETMDIPHQQFKQIQKQCMSE